MDYDAGDHDTTSLKSQLSPFFLMPPVPLVPWALIKAKVKVWPTGLMNNLIKIYKINSFMTKAVVGKVPFHMR